MVIDSYLVFLRFAPYVDRVRHLYYQYNTSPIVLLARHGSNVPHIARTQAHTRMHAIMSTYEHTHEQAIYSQALKISLFCTARAYQYNSITVAHACLSIAPNVRSTSLELPRAHSPACTRLPSNQWEWSECRATARAHHTQLTDVCMARFCASSR